jgi:ferredoxin
MCKKTVYTLAAIPTLGSAAVKRPTSPAPPKQPVQPAVFPERISPTMKVWIDQDLCTGDGLCEEIAPDVFALLDDGLAYVKEGDKILSEPAGAEAVAPVPAGQEEATIESAEECPGECIYIEVD